jgi:hypothetical protein
VIAGRTFGKLALASLPTAAARAKIDSTVPGVRIGVSGYSFRSQPQAAPRETCI